MTCTSVRSPSSRVLAVQKVQSRLHNLVHDEDRTKVLGRDYMKTAVKEACDGVESGDGAPFGAVIVRDGNVIAVGHNMVFATNDPTMHAEVTAIRNACKKIGDYNLSGCTLYTSCYPCPMCMGACLWARLSAIYYAATPEEAAAAGFDDKVFHDFLKNPRTDEKNNGEVFDNDKIRNGEMIKMWIRYNREKRALHLTEHQLTVSTSSSTVSLPLSSATRFVIVAFGKASILMTLAAEKCLGSRLLEGIVIAPIAQVDKDWKLRSQIFYGAHNNLPDVNSVTATNEALQCIQKNDAPDVVFLFLISGGGSALFCSPDGISLEEKLTTIHILTSNGGKTLNYIKKGQVLSLLMSDLIDDLIQFIASGPTVLQTSSMQELSDQIVTSSKWTSILPPDILDKLQVSPLSGPVVIPHNIIVASNRDALAELKNYFTSHGYDAHIVTARLRGDATNIGKDFAELITTGRESLPDILVKFGGRNDEALLGNKIALLFGGETTVIIRGSGRGGRCQEMALSCFISLCSCSTTPPPFLFMAAGTDGLDGPTDAAGAFFTNDDLNGTITSEAESYLQTSNSYSFWSMYNDGRNHIKLGPTGTNVMDIQIVLLQFE
ncbi:hypothetical protein KIN20_011546 [Parelaphostrongylus tenuis]|uniref:CMP/dCMP-type deaminase domain-containing protein n=1 Tax=Parelaphostrongylus tenuis TaxID=148309 RepID=A0AAD5QM46_PARTN|nr:hypothetical protein KIN20_011546 [Parelaphostrongylus tenuis]